MMFYGKVIAFILILLTALQLAAANIVCTTYPVWLIARDIVGSDSDLQVKLLMKQTGNCAHEYNPTPQDLKQLAMPDTILICNGMDLDKHLVHSAYRVNKKLQVVNASDAGDTFDVHNFAAPDTALRMAENISQELSKLLPEQAAVFQKNHQVFASAMQKIIKDVPLPHSGKTVILQSNLFRNMARFAGLSVEMLHLERASAVSPAKLQKLLRHNRNQKFQAILAEEDLNDPASEKISFSGKIPIIKLNMFLSGPDDPPAHYFITVMQSNLVKLQKGLAR